MFTMKKIIISEKKFNKVLKLIKEQEEGEYYEISANEFRKIAEAVGFKLGVLRKYKKFQGKPLKIIGDLDLSKTEVNSLGDIVIVTGDLDLSNTKLLQNLGELIMVGKTLDISKSEIASVQGVTYKYLRKWDSKLEKLEIAREERVIRMEADERREENVWDLNDEYIDDVGLKANALFDFLVGSGELNEISDDERERLNSLKQELEELNERYDNTEDANEINTLFDQITDIELEIEEIVESGSDVYDMIPKKYEHYGLEVFRVVGLGRDVEYAVGTEEEADEALQEYSKSYVEEVGLDGFREGYIDQYVDGDEVADYFEDWWRDDIYESPESYFNDDDFELTEEQEARIEYLEEKISEYEERLYQYEGEHGDEYYQIQEIIDELQEELDSIEPITEPTDEMVEEKLEERLSDVRRNPVGYLKDYGYDIKQFVDIDGLVEGLASDEGYGILSPYDGSYDVEYIKEKPYYIFRVN
jgi:hypothetical protein